MWTQHPSFNVEVARWWGESPSSEDPVLSFSSKLQKKMKSWERVTFGNIKSQKALLLSSIQKLEAKLETGPLGQAEFEELDSSKQKLLEAQGKEEIMWKQRSKERWIKGDRNSKFFHSFTSVRKRKSRILELEEGGELITEDA